MSCIIYARVSTAKDEQAASLEAQKSRCLEYAKRKKLVVREIYEETHSAKESLDRPELQKALASVKRGEQFIVAALSRLSRNVMDTLTMIKDFKAQGVELITIDQDIDDQTPTGKLMRQINAAMAEFESNQISKRVKDGMGFKKLKGESLGRPSYGQKKADKHYAMDEKEQEAIWIMLEMKKAHHTLKEIIDTLNEGGYKPKMGGSWYPCTVCKIINYYSSYLL